ncbi:MAG: SDR family oxidoreductase, partial [Myxococcales bacterium]|nr:SDR family oxidoreductase [Myxococcales bacterium]
MSAVHLVTGAASGIGRGLVDALSKRDARILATDVDAAGLRAARDSLGWDEETVRLRPLDVRRPGDWEAALDAAEAAFGPVDVLLNVAGYLAPGWIHEATVEEVERHFDINAKGVALGLRAASARMVARGSGHIVNIASMAALAPISGLTLYSASKYAVRGLSLAAAGDLKPHGVSVSCVCPDAVATPMLDVQADRPEAALTFSGTVLQVEQVVGAILDDVLPRRPLELWLPRSR